MHAASIDNVPLTVISNPNTQYLYASMAIGSNVLTQTPPVGNRSYWFVVINRYTLKVEYNALQASPNTPPDIGALNTSDHILVVATLGLGLDVSPQGALFAFLDVNGAGMQLRRIEQLAQQYGCGTLGTFSYALVGVLGNQNVPGFEGSGVAGTTFGPILTLQLMPTTYGGQTIYTPVQLSNA